MPVSRGANTGAASAVDTIAAPAGPEMTDSSVAPQSGSDQHRRERRHPAMELHLSTTAAGPGPAGDATSQPQASPSGPSIARGALLVLEGLDRSGKTTQVRLLEQRLVAMGKKVQVMRFPDRTTPIGQMIDAYLRSEATMEDHVIHLLFSANRWEAARAMAGLLAAGTTVVCDRYYHSGIVYSAAKRNPALTLAWARAPEAGLPRPDLVLFLDLSEDEARRRGGWGGEVYEKAETQRRVRDLFWGLSMGKIETGSAGQAHDGDGEWRGDGVVALGSPTPDTRTGAEVRFRQEEEDLSVVDASSSIDEVAEEIWKIAGPRIEAVERGEMGRHVRRVL